MISNEIIDLETNCIGIAAQTIATPFEHVTDTVRRRPDTATAFTFGFLVIDFLN